MVGDDDVGTAIGDVRDAVGEQAKFCIGTAAE